MDSSFNNQEENYTKDDDNDVPLTSDDIDVNSENSKPPISNAVSFIINTIKHKNKLIWTLNGEETLDQFAYRVRQVIFMIDNFLSPEYSSCDKCSIKTEMECLALFFNGLPSKLFHLLESELEKTDITSLDDALELTKSVVDVAKDIKVEMNEEESEISLHSIRGLRPKVILDIEDDFIQPKVEPKEELVDMEDDDVLSQPYDDEDDDDDDVGEDPTFNVSIYEDKRRVKIKEEDEEDDDGEELDVKSAKAKKKQIELDLIRKKYGDLFYEMPYDEFKKIKDEALVKYHRKDFKCSYCQKVLHSQNSYIFHILGIHDKVYRYKCNICEWGTSKDMKSMERHYHTSHAKDEIWNEERVCKAVVKRKRSDHIACPHCPKKFKRWYLDIHLRKIHNMGDYRIENHVCELCGKFYRNRPSLKIHIRRDHNKEANHACHLCDKKFIVLSHLKKHIRSFHERKKATCHICGALFPVDSLNFHIASIHDRSTTVQCNVCQKSYFTPSALRRHIKTDHQKEVLKCELCPKTYTQTFNFKRHMKRDHNIIKKFHREYKNGQWIVTCV